VACPRMVVKTHTSFRMFFCRLRCEEAAGAIALASVWRIPQDGI
jgi:hypothetical protein